MNAVVRGLEWSSNRFRAKARVTANADLGGDSLSSDRG